MKNASQIIQTRGVFAGAATTIRKLRTVGHGQMMRRKERLFIRVNNPCARSKPLFDNK